VIDSLIDGDFVGWQGKTVVKLTNGQLWQQVGNETLPGFAHMPTVVIFRTLSGWRMKVADEEAIAVRRLQ
jgi:hypothetical protein